MFGVSLRTRRLWFACSFILIPLILFFPYLIGRKLLGGPDLETFYLPLLQFFPKEMHLGHFPLWNPYILMGRSAWGEIENALFYPPRWLLFWKPETSIVFFLVGHLVWAHFGGFRLARILEMNRMSAWVCGFLFAYNGWFASHILCGHPLIVATATWLPHILATLLSYSDSKSWRIWMATLFLEGTMITQAGSPQIAYYGSVFLLLAVLALKPRLFFNRGFVFGLLLAALAAALVLAPQGIGMAIFHRESVRAGDYPWERAIWFRLFPYQWKEFFFGPPRSSITHPGVHLYETGVFIGSLAVVLAVWAAFTRNRRALALWMVALFFLALGMASPQWLLKGFRLLPGAGSFRSPGRFLINTLLALSLLAGWGWQNVSIFLRPRLRPKILQWTACLAGIAIVFPLAIHFRLYIPEASERLDSLRADLASMARAFTGETRPRAMMGGGPLHPNQFFEEGVEMVAGRSAPLTSWRYVNFVSGPTDHAYWIEIYEVASPAPHSSRSLLAAPLYFSTGKEGKIPGLRWAGHVPPYDIFLDPSAVPRVRFFATGLAVKDRLEARKLLWEGKNAISELWYEGPSIQNLNVETRGACEYKLPSTDAYDIHCRTDGRGFVWISQAYFPGWEARVNGVPAPVYPAHLLFQAIPIPGGESQILLEFHPKYMNLSLILAAIGLMIPLGILTFRRRKTSKG